VLHQFQCQLLCCSKPHLLRLPPNLAAELHGGTCTADLQEADLFVLQHRRQPECEEARRLFRPAVGLLWVLTCITTGQLVPATSQVLCSAARGRSLGTARKAAAAL
jgi:hypothetical protein